MELISDKEVTDTIIVQQIELPDLGKLTKLRIWHEKRNPFAGWHLSKVRFLKSNYSAHFMTFLGINIWLFFLFLCL